MARSVTSMSGGMYERWGSPTGQATHSLRTRLDGPGLEPAGPPSGPVLVWRESVHREIQEWGSRFESTARGAVSASA